MAPSLRDLIDFLLAEIALCGDQGATPADILSSVNTFYAKAAQDASDRNHSVDRRFQEKVWSWLTRNPEVSVGSDREGNHLSLSEAEGHGQINQEAEASRNAVRVFVSEERTWLAITGHERDESRVFSTEFALLSIIASRKEAGIVQTELVRLSGQDKRSVPKRTEVLHQKGYIDKRAIQIKSARTSLCTLRKFVTTDVSPLDAAAAAGQQSNGLPHGKDVIDYKEFVDNLFQILGQYKIIGRNDLKNLLGFADHWRWRILSRALRKCERLGVLKRVKALTQYADTINKYHPCVLLLREPTQREIEMLNEFSLNITTNLGHADNVELDEDIDPNDEDLGSNESQPLRMVKREEDMEEAGRMLPTWTPDRNIHNQIFETVDKAGTPGITNIDIIRTCFGGFFRRPLENALSRLVACWQLSQPLHLRHLAIVRDIALRRTITHYVHYSANNFRKLVDARESTWEAVEYVPKSSKGNAVRVPPVEAPPELDEYGFSIDIPRKELLRCGNATLLECMLSVKPTDYSCTSTDLSAVQREGDTYAIHYGQKYSEGPHPERLITPKRPRAAPRRDTDLEMEDGSEKVVSVSRGARKKRDDASRFVGMSEKEKLEALGLDETWTEYSVLLIERSQPGVFVTPRGRRRPAGKRQGRPRISRLAVFKSPKLASSFPWFVSERKDEEDKETEQTSRSESASGTTPAVAHEDQSSALLDEPTETPSRGTRANLRRRASVNDPVNESGRAHKQRRLNGTTLTSPEASNNQLADKRAEHEGQDESTPSRRSKRRRVESPIRDSPVVPTDKTNSTPEERIEEKTPSKQSGRTQKSHKSPPVTADELPPGSNGTASEHSIPTNGAQQDPSGKSPVAETKPTIISQISERPQPRKIPEKGGSVNVLRRKIILDILRQAGGVFPMGNELWYPFSFAWKRLNYKGKPDLRTIKTTVKHMVDAGKLRQHTFSGRDRKGIMVTKSIISQTDLQPDASTMQELQRKMLAADPRRPYIPESVEFDRDMTKSGRRSLPQGNRRPPIEQNITVQLHQKPGAVLAAERRKGLNIERRLFEKLAAAGTGHRRKPPRLMKISRRPAAEDSLHSLTSIIRPPNKTDVLAHTHRADVKPSGRSIPRRKTGGRLNIPLSAMAPYAMVMNPRQAYHAGSGTFATHAGLISLQIPRDMILQDLAKIREAEQHDESEKESESESEIELEHEPEPEPEPEPQSVLPKSLDDIFSMTRRRVMDYSDKQDPRSRRFFLDNNVILKWELRNEELLQNQSTEDLPYINQTVSDLFSAPIQGKIRFDLDEPAPPARPPPELKTTRQTLRRLLPSAFGPATKSPPPSRVEKTGPSYEPIPQNRRLNKLLDPNITTPAATAAAHSQSPAAKIRRNRVSNQLPEVLVQKIMTAIVVIRTLASGSDARLIDWNLLSYCFPDHDPTYIQERAKVVLNRTRLPIAKMQNDFQELYLDAYEHDRVPPIDYDDLENYDWEWIVDWATEQLEVPRSEKEKLPYLPATREQFDSVFEIREEAPASLDDIYQTSHTTTVNRRRTLFAGVPFAIPVTAGNKMMTARQAELARLDIAKSWVRANVITSDEVYDSAAARQILSRLEGGVDQALQSLITERVLCTGNKGRVIPGRNYDVTELFLHSLGRKRAIEATELRRAAQFKTETLDLALRKQGVFDISYNAEDGDILALINLLATGRVLLQPRDPPRDKYGLTDGGYLTRLIDKQKLRFPIEVRPVKGKYIFGDPIEETKSSIPAPRLPPTDLDSPEPVFQKIPLWYDIHGNFVAKLWELALAAVVGCVATRPGINASGIASMMKPSLGAWEIELILEWTCQVGVMRRGGDGWIVQEWWWMLVR